MKKRNNEWKIIVRLESKNAVNDPALTYWRTDISVSISSTLLIRCTEKVSYDCIHVRFFFTKLKKWLPYFDCLHGLFHSCQNSLKHLWIRADVYQWSRWFMPSGYVTIRLFLLEISRLDSQLMTSSTQREGTHVQDEFSTENNEWNIPSFFSEHMLLTWRSISY